MSPVAQRPSVSEGTYAGKGKVLDSGRAGGDYAQRRGGRGVQLYIGWRQYTWIRGDWEGQRSYTAPDRAHSITLRKLRAYPTPSTFLILPLRPPRPQNCFEEGQPGGGGVLNSMVSASSPMMVDLWKPEVLLRVMGVKLESRLIPPPLTVSLINSRGLGTLGTCGLRNI